MRALVLKENWKLAVEDVADPELRPDEVMIEIVATGICGSDFHGFSGENGRRRPGQIMGHETVGRIAAVGSAVREGLSVGATATVNPVIGCGQCDSCAAGQQPWCADKRVIGVDPTYRSAFAEKMAVPAANVVLLPDSMPTEYGALIEPLSVGYHALNRGRCRSGDTVLVIGGGPIGQACVLAAQRLGARTVAVSEMSASRRELVAGLGAVPVDPAGRTDLAPAVTSALGAPPTVIVDAVGVQPTIATAFACAPLGSSIVLVGMGSPELTLPAFEVSTKERSVVGSFCYTADEFAETAEWAVTVPKSLGTLIDGRVDIDGAQEAFTHLAKGTSPAGKIIVLFDGSLTAG
jgi:threonine dehydrogenase-like Zn-dependent dehydrogenase